MTPQSVAQREVEGRLGLDAMNDAVWQDVRLFQTTASKLALATWDLSAQNRNNFYRIFHPQNEADRRAYDDRCEAVVKELRARLGESAAARAAAAFLLHPQFWPQAYGGAGYDEGYYLQQALQGVLQRIAERCLALQQPRDWVERLGQRLYDLGTVRVLHPHVGGSGGAGDFLACIRYLLASREAPTDLRIGALLDALTVGDYGKAWHSIELLAGRSKHGVWRLVEAIVLEGKPERSLETDAVERVKAFWQAHAAYFAITFLARLDAQEQLCMPSFRRLLESSPGCLPAITGFVNRSASQPGPGQAVRSPWLSRLADATFVARLRQLADTVVWELIDDFRPEVWPALLQIAHFSGGCYLLRIAEEVQHCGLEKLHASKYGSWYGKHTAEMVLAVQLGKLQRHASDDGAALVALLGQLNVPTLLAILPHARAYEAEICAALGWDGALTLVELLHRLEAANPATSTDPAAGVVQRAE